MGELLDRDFQRHILRTCAAEYPRRTPSGRFHEGPRDRRLLVNSAYLDDHGLLRAAIVNTPGDEVVLVDMVITARGLDFLANDGGLSAILGVVTVKLHDDTIRQLLTAKIAESEGDPSVKDKLIKAVKDAPADVLKSVTQKALEEGLRQLPNAVQLIQTWFTQLQ